MYFYLFSICRKTSEDSRRVKLRACQHRVHYMPFLAYSQSHVTDKLAGSIVSSANVQESKLGFFFFQAPQAIYNKVRYGRICSST